MPADVVRRLRGRWTSGALLSARAAGCEWAPIGVPVRGPTVTELGRDLAAAQAWAGSWAAATGVRVEHRSVGGRKVGVNKVPARIWIDSPDQLWRLLGVTREVERFDALFHQTSDLEPMLLDWMAAHPLKVVDLSADWLRLVHTVTWVSSLRDKEIYLRQIDVPGVDTKFVEAHRSVLTELLDLRLPPERIDAAAPRSDFTRRFRFRKKPSYVRLRGLGSKAILGGYSEVALPVHELAAEPLPVQTVYVVENEVTYLAFPDIPDAIVLLGGGYAVSSLGPLTWLRDRQLVYWGDIDSHGFRILHRLREHFPDARSMLMDRATLLAHEQHWGTEASQVREPLTRLTGDEEALYHDLVEDTFGSSLRLEQERVRYSAIERAVGPRSYAPAPWSGHGRRLSR